MGAVWVSTRPEIHTNWLDSDEHEVHITLAYMELGTFDQVKHKLRESTRPHIRTVWISGFGTWYNPDRFVLYASVGSLQSSLHDYREDLVYMLEDYDPAPVRVSKEYPFTPHITLDWSEVPFTEMPWLTKPYVFNIDNLYVSEDNYHEEIWSNGKS